LNEEFEDDIENLLISFIDSKLISIIETKSMLIREKEVIEHGQNISNPTSEIYDKRTKTGDNYTSNKENQYKNGKISFMKIPDRDFLDSHLKTLMNKREEVFRPFHNAPTMSLDEFADNEIQIIETKEKEKKDQEALVN